MMCGPEEITFDKFLEACANGDVKIVDEAINYFSPDLIAQNRRRCDALYFAIKGGHLPIVNRLLEIPAVLANVSGALYDAVQNGHLPIVNRLLEIPAVLANVSGALHAALKNGHLPIVNRLLEIEAVRDNVTADDNVALKIAAARGQLELVNNLLKIPAVKEKLWAYGVDNLLCIAVCCNQLSVVEHLLGFQPLRYSSASTKNELLKHASQRGHLAVVNCLLKDSAFMYEVTPDGIEKALDRAARNGHLAVVRRLFEIKGVNCVFENKKISGDWLGFFSFFLRTLCCPNTLSSSAEREILENCPRLKASVEREKRTNEACAFLCAYMAARKPGYPNSLLRSIPRDMARLIGQTIKKARVQP